LPLKTLTRAEEKDNAMKWYVAWYVGDVKHETTVEGSRNDLDRFLQDLKANGTPAFTWYEI